MRPSYLRKTHQVWKLWISLGVLPIVGLGLVAATLSDLAGKRPEEQALFALFGIITAVGGYVWGVVSIRCARCKARILWHSMKNKRVADWLAWLLDVERCPVCGDS